VQTLNNILSGAGVALFTFFFFGMCIFVHELGHLLAALWRGLQPEKFSVGFGKKIWGFKRGGVQYQVSMIPFGGYVALPQLDPSDTEPETSDGRKLPFAKPLDRMIVAFAGPAANVVFGFFLALFIWWFGVFGPPPRSACEVFEVAPKSAEYQAGLRPGDRIIAVNGKTFRKGWQSIFEKVVLSEARVTLSVERDGKRLPVSYLKQENPNMEKLSTPFFSVCGPVVVKTLRANFPAHLADVRPADQLLTVNGRALKCYDDLADQIQASTGASVEVGLLRPVTDKKGREILDENGVPRREPLTKTVEVVAGRDKDGKLLRRENGALARMIGVGETTDLMILTHPNPWEQFMNTLTRTRDTLQALFTRGSGVNPSHMSGPIGIIQATSVSVYLGGWRKGLDFVILICFSLAIFNLLPLPVLDGGHIMIAFIEMVIRRRIPAKLAEYVQIGFVVLLVGFMLYVSVFDVKRTPKMWRNTFGGLGEVVPVKLSTLKPEELLPVPPENPAPAAAAPVPAAPAVK
jgi:regulator of sigma E protease